MKYLTKIRFTGEDVHKVVKRNLRDYEQLGFDVQLVEAHGIWHSQSLFPVDAAGYSVTKIGSQMVYLGKTVIAPTPESEMVVLIIMEGEPLEE